MSRKMYALLLPVLAIAAMAMTAGAAQAAPHWFACKKLATETGKFTDSECQKAGKGFWEWVKLPEAPKTQVITFGTLKLTSGTLAITCKVSDAGNIWNTAAGGLDEITLFVNYECTAVPAAECPEPEIIAEKLPWKTKLAAGPVDEIEGVQVTLWCSKKPVITFSGKLTPKIVQATETEPLVAEFTAATGELEEPVSKVKAKVEGKDRVLGFEHGEQIKVE